MTKAFNVLFGLVIWGGLIYLVIFNVLDSPSYKVPVDREIVSVAEATSASQVTTTSEINPSLDSEKSTQSLTVQDRQVTEDLVEDKQVDPELQSELSPSQIPAGWYIQVGAFKNQGRARTYGLQFSSQGYQPLFEKGDDGLTRILIGPYTSEEKAVLARSKISEQTDAKDSIVRRISAAS